MIHELKVLPNLTDLTLPAPEQQKRTNFLTFLFESSLNKLPTLFLILKYIGFHVIFTPLLPTFYYTITYIGFREFNNQEDNIRMEGVSFKSYLCVAVNSSCFGATNQSAGCQIVGAAGLSLIVYAGLGYNDWKEFYQYFSSSKLVHATSLDFSLLSAFAPFWVYNDMTARKRYDKTAWLLPLSIVPFVGPALYLLLRPPLTTLPVSLENTLKSD